MKKLLLGIGMLAFTSLNAHAWCEAEAEAFIETEYSVVIAEARDIGYGGSENMAGPLEVWLKDTNGGTYSVFFQIPGCDTVLRHIVYGDSEPQR